MEIMSIRLKFIFKLLYQPSVTHENAGITILKNIYDLYLLDFLKYSKSIDPRKLRTVFENIPCQLAKENLNFVYRNISNYSRSEKFEDALL
jgi:uncharacterized Fe-S radical SAM superfamily protein PflX